VHRKVVEFLTMLRPTPMSRKKLMEQMDLTNQTNNRIRYLDPLLKLGWVEKVFPGEKINPHQLYQLTGSGRRLLHLLNVTVNHPS
ncbi:MAG TPA: hypothetical protein VFX43_09225, partial [Chitinophagaceae bacterium]|nr:hypothetical protein [Chitinophagaceae bacterium]